MMTGRHSTRCQRIAQHRRAQSGMVMVMTLICLVLMLIGAVALTRSSTISLLQAGNFAFKRDLLNQAERGIAVAIAELKKKSEADRQANINDINYSATQLTANAQGIPLVLINESAFGSSKMSQADFTDDDAHITIRTVIDRQCSATGAFKPSLCVSVPDPGQQGTDQGRDLEELKASMRPTYRISVHVTGPRGTETFQQMIITL